MPAPQPHEPGESHAVPEPLPTTIEGQRAIALKDTSKGGTLYVATSGKPYPLEIAKAGKESGKVILDRWDQPVTLKAPAGAIDISELQKAG